MTCVVVVEDEFDVREMIREILEIDGHEAWGISGDEEVESTLACTHPDLFLMDIMLHGQSGIEVAQKLRAHGYEDTPMIAMTASFSMAMHAERSGLFQDTIHKPFDIDALLQRVAQHVKGQPAKGTAHFSPA